MLSAVPGTGLGILRPTRAPGTATSSDEAPPVSPSFNRLPADARAKAREHKLLILTKANSRATVHRPSYLDYIGVKKFDAEGNVIGERRFLGLFSSAAYTESVRRVPVLRRKVDEVLEGAGFAPDSHDGQDLLADPGDLPARRAVPDLGRRAAPIAPACCTCRSAAGCGCSCARTSTAATISAWSTCRATATPPRSGCGCRRSCWRSCGGTAVDFTALDTESVLARLHFVVRVEPGKELPDLTDADVERIENRLADATRSWADGFAEALIAECGEERAAELAAPLQPRLPRGLQGRLPAARRPSPTSSTSSG